jgi:AraC-like DNA-binding protein
MPFDEVVFSRDLMDHRMPGADPRLNRILTAQAEELLSTISPPPRPPTFVETVEQALVNGLAEGDVTLTRLADHLGLSARTVQRRLREMGVTHRSLVRTLRLEMAARSLMGAGGGGGEVSQGKIARALGYSGAGSFHRAFKSWAGVTPGQARARSRGPSSR